MVKHLKDRPFYLGFGKKTNSEIAKVIYPSFAILILGFTLVSLFVSSSLEDPGDGRFRGAVKGGIIGVVELRPYPVLRVPADEEVPARTIMLSGGGKRGALENISNLDGKLHEVAGAWIKRGDLSMIQVNSRRTKEVELGILATEEVVGRLEKQRK